MQHFLLDSLLLGEHQHIDLSQRTIDILNTELFEEDEQFDNLHNIVEVFGAEQQSQCICDFADNLQYFLILPVEL